MYSDQLEPGFKFRLYRINDVDDEAADGHPLYNKGLERYRAHIIENSSWIQELKQIHKVHPQYSEDHWKKRSTIFYFHDEMLEVIASGGYTIELFQTTMKALIAEVGNRMGNGL